MRRAISSLLVALCLSVLLLALFTLTARAAGSRPQTRNAPGASNRVAANLCPCVEITVYPTQSIQVAIDKAAGCACATVVVMPGLYTESLTISGTPVSLTGSSLATTIIHAVAGQRVLTVTGIGIGPSVVISGLTLAGGTAPNGGGIYLPDGCQPLIRNVVVSDCRATGSGLDGLGGGIYTRASAPLQLAGVTFISNTASNIGGGAFLVGGGTLTDCIFERNSAVTNAGGLYSGFALHVTGTTFLSNTASVTTGLAGGLCAGGSLWMTGSTFISNTAASAGGVYAMGTAQVSGSRFERNCSTVGVYDNAGGGGLRSGGAATLSEVTFLSNTAGATTRGGGVFAGGALTVTGSRFEANAAGGYGGGLFGDGALVLSQTQFISNTSDHGGGGAAGEGSTVLAGSWFEHNTSPWGHGGGILVNPDMSGAPLLTITGSTFMGNSSNGTGGGAAAQGPATVADSRFEGNRSVSSSGGGLCAGYGGAPVNIARSRFLSNSAGSFGGGLYADGPLTLTASVLADNDAEHGGGAAALVGAARLANVLFAGNGAAQCGASLYASGSSLEIIHGTFAGRPVNPGAAICIGGAAATIRNTIVTSHAVGIWLSTGSCSEDYNLFFGNATGLYGPIEAGAHSLTGADPRFRGPHTRNYRIGADSPAFNRALDLAVAVDLDGNPRPAWGAPDIGAYEARELHLVLPLEVR